ncbi:Retrotransposable element Tf2 protein [Ceratobasidium sp. AG-Ba]|nr:Retrotransposable element Tf2 protein [Ceratobasidium sp. AG-Ba]
MSRASNAPPLTQPTTVPLSADPADITLPGMPGGMPQDQPQIIHPRPQWTIHIPDSAPSIPTRDDSVDEVDEMTRILQEQGEEVLSDQQTQPPLSFGDQEGNVTQQAPGERILVPLANNPIRTIAVALQQGLSTLKSNVLREVQKSIEATESNKRLIEAQRELCEVTQGEATKAVNNAYVAAERASKIELQIEVEGKTLRCDLYVMPLGDTEIILGKDWLDEAEPIIAWKDLTITYKDHTSGKAATDEPVIPKEFADFLDLFQEEGFRELPPHREEFDCAIDLIEGAELPKPAKTYPMTPAESEALEKYIEQELKDGKIRRSQSSMAAPCFYVNKADGGLRLVVDYRKLNAITKPYRFPMPVQTELLEQLKDAKIFSKMDIRWGFNNIRIREGDEWKTAFRTRWGTYETLVMPFGIINGPAYFQAYVNDIFKDLIGVNVVVYMDDILVFSRNREDHIKHVREVLKRLRANHLFLKPHKCHFFTTETSFIGIVISPEGISMEKEKVKAILEWKAPTTVKQVQAFLGLAGFYRRWVENFSTKAKPLTELTRKGIKFKWTDREEKAFQDIKEAITKEPVLIHPKPDEPYILETDASGVALGAVLSQKGDDGRLHPIAYLSQSFTPPQRNYDTYDKELLAIVHALEHWRLLLEGTKIPITVYTDHRNLQYWQEAKVWNRRHARWYLLLASFNYQIVYRPGKMSEKPDALSRRHDHGDIPVEPQIMIAPDKFIGFMADISSSFLDEVREAQKEDETIRVLWESVSNKEELPPSVRKEFRRYDIKNGILEYDGKIYIPDDRDLRLEILQRFHDSPIAGHQGHARTLELISREYYWPGIKAQVNRYVDTCEICQRSKGHKQSIPHRPLPIPEKPWEDIAYDFIVKLPKSNGYDSILTVIDRFSRQAHFIPCLESTNAEELAEIFIREIWKLHGTPKTTVSDRGPTFNSQFLRALYKGLKIEPRFSTAYHPETDGISERTNQWVEGFLRTFCNYRQDDWTKWLPIAEFCHNNHVNSATGQTAFETVYGTTPRWNMLKGDQEERDTPAAYSMKEKMKRIWDEAKASMELHRTLEKPSKELKVGDKVWLLLTNLSSKRPTKKLDNRKGGPFTITEKISSHAYRLDLPKTIRVHNVFHINLLSPVTEDKDFHRKQVKPPPIITEEGEEEYEVDHVVNSEWRNGRLYYQIRWKGYDPIEDTMERAEKFAEMHDLLADLRKRLPGAPMPNDSKGKTKSSKQKEGRSIKQEANEGK